MSNPSIDIFSAGTDDFSEQALEVVQGGDTINNATAQTVSKERVPSTSKASEPRYEYWVISEYCSRANSTSGSLSTSNLSNSIYGSALYLANQKLEDEGITPGPSYASMIVAGHIRLYNGQFNEEVYPAGTTYLAGTGITHEIASNQEMYIGGYKRYSTPSLATSSYTAYIYRPAATYAAVNDEDTTALQMFIHEMFGVLVDTKEKAVVLPGTVAECAEWSKRIVSGDPDIITRIIL